MKTELANPVTYHFPIDNTLVDMNALIGKHISMTFTGLINCHHCGKKTKKSFAQGYCYSCMTRLAQCDSCIMSPEKCHYAAGTCREPSWGETHCMIDHIVYLANSSSIKVGITRASQVPTRWIDQGATEALPIFRTSTRMLSGLVEVIFKDHIADKTNWRKMLKNENDIIDLAAERDRLFAETYNEIARLTEQYGLQSVQRIEELESTKIEFPVLQYPEKITSLSFDKTPVISGNLQGIKGQYLLLDSGVLNLRTHTSYFLEMQADI